MKKERKYLNDINEYVNKNGAWKSKALRNLRVYEYTPSLSLQNLSDDEVVGYFQGSIWNEEDTTSIIQENIVRSTIDTLVSKIASQKVRPFINTVNGSFKDMQVVKSAQTFFDSFFEENDVNKQVSLAFRDACIFDRGYVFVDKVNKRIIRALPWQVFIDSKEKSYDKVTKVVYQQKHFPTSLLNVDTRLNEVTYIQLWDIKAHKHVIYIQELDLYKEEEYLADVIPFVTINYSNPVKGNSSSCVVDLLYGIQKEVDQLVAKIKDASQLASPLKYFVPQQSNIKVEKLSNRVGEVITYNLPPNYNGNPVTVATEPFMDPEWMKTLEQFKQHAYELVGISQLSAMSQKPKGLDSGVALSTMEDIESDRFETQLNSVIRSYVELAKVCIKVFDGSILPPNKLRASNVTWDDIVAMQDNMTIQFSAAENLSKDPSMKLQQLQALVAAGVIPQSRVAQLMEIPDLQQGYSFANNAINAVMAVIDDCIERDNYEIPFYIPIDMLQEEIVNTCLSLKGANSIENNADINKLMQLFAVAEKMKINSQTSAEMAASQGLQNEIAADLQNPNGVINTQVNNQLMQLQMAQMQGQALQGA